jgi:peptidyl-prolyl cis-trans isomerase C
LIYYILQAVIGYFYGGIMSVVRKWIFRSSYYVFVFILFSCTQKDPIIVRIGKDHAITKSEFQAYFNFKSRRLRDKKPTIQDYRDQLENMINDQIKIYYAYQLGLNKDSTVMARTEPQRQNILMSKLYREEVSNYVIKEKDIRDFYSRTGKEVLIRSILLNCPSNMSPSQQDSIRTLALGVYKKIKNGELFSDMARLYSQDEATAMNGGMVGALTYTRSNDPIRNTAFSMRLGDVSLPIKNDRGYNIIKIEEIRETERKPFKKAHDEIRDQIATDKQALITERAKKYWDNVKIKSKLAWNAKAVDSLVSFFNPTKPYIKNEIIDILKQTPTDLNDMVLVRYDKGIFKVSDFKKKVESISFPYNGMQIGNKEAMKYYIERWILAEVLIQIAQDERLDHEKMIQNEIKLSLEKNMLANIQTQIYGDVLPTDNDVKSFYLKEKLDRYSTPELVKIQEVMVKDKALAEKIKTLVVKKKNMGPYPAMYTIRPGLKEKNGIIAPFPKGTLGKVGETAFKLSVGEIAGPIPTDNNAYSVIKLLEKIPPKEKPFEKVKNKVLRDLIVLRQTEKDQAWLQAKKREVPIRINEKVLLSMLNEK